MFGIVIVAIACIIFSVLFGRKNRHETSRDNKNWELDFDIESDKANNTAINLSSETYIKTPREERKGQTIYGKTFGVK